MDWDAVAAAAFVVLCGILYQLVGIHTALRSISSETQMARKQLVRFLATDEAHELAWEGWPHMTARLLEEIQSDVRDFRRKMIGRESHD